MKKALIVIAAICVAALAAGGVATAIWFLSMKADSFSKAEQLSRGFVAALVAGDGERIRSLVTSENVENVEVAFVKTVAGEIEHRLGTYEGIKPRTLRWSKKISTKDEPLEVRCQLQFSKGLAELWMQVVDHHVVSFRLMSPLLPPNWEPVPTDTRLWQDKGSKFIMAFTEAKVDEVSAMMCPDLRKVVPLERLRLEIKAFQEEAGRTLSVEFLSEEKKEESNQVMFRYKLTCEKVTQGVKVTYAFIGLRGWLTGFKLTKPEQ